jgi:hypothetical protein
MAERSSWMGSAALDPRRRSRLIQSPRFPADRGSDRISRDRPAGPKIPGVRWPPASHADSCGHWASTLCSVVMVEPEAGSLGCVQLGKIPSAPSAASALGQDNLRRDRPVTCATTRSPRFGRPCPIGQCLRHCSDGADGADASAAFRGLTAESGRNLTAPTSGAPPEVLESGCQRWHGSRRTRLGAP